LGSQLIRLGTDQSCGRGTTGEEIAQEKEKRNSPFINNCQGTYKFPRDESFGKIRNIKYEIVT